LLIYTSATARFVASFGNVLFSLILGAIAMGFFWVNYPDEFVRLQRVAALVHEWIMERGWSARVESILRFLLEGRQLLFMGFVLAVRLLLSVAVLVFGFLFQQLKSIFAGNAASAASKAPRNDS
jgi:hypothetical protein